MGQCTAKVDALLYETINSRREALRNGGSSDDLLGRMLTAATEGWDEKALAFNLASVLNNCKLFYFAGQGTVANVTNFAMLMLAVYPVWQDRARKEVHDVLGDEENYNMNAISRLTMVCKILCSIFVKLDLDRSDCDNVIRFQMLFQIRSLDLKRQRNHRC